MVQKMSTRLDKIIEGDICIYLAIQLTANIINVLTSFVNLTKTVSAMVHNVKAIALYAGLALPVSILIYPIIKK